MKHDRRSLLRFGLYSAATLWVPKLALADDASRGREIAEKADRLQRGFGDMKAKMIMILKDRRGQETRRELEASTLETKSGGEKSLVYFNSPRDIRGTALLTHSHPGREDEQWLYLPAVRRTKRISVTGRSSPFMGSEFAYEDLVTAYPSQYDYRFLREEALRGTACFVVERYPKYKGTGYQRQQVWYDQKEYRIVQIEFFDLKNRRLKTLSLGGYKQYLDRFWEPTQARMVNHLTREATELGWRDYRFHTGLSENDFSRHALERAR